MPKKTAVVEEEEELEEGNTPPVEYPVTGEPPLFPDEILASEELGEPERALVVAEPQQHLISGLAALASLSDEEFNEKVGMLQRGQERLETLVKTLLKSGEDYGRVPGISKPFLHLPGAEKLEKFYGYAVRQESKIIPGELDATLGWKSPPLSVEVYSYVHLRDFDGPVIDQGFGTANSWEDKYRYRFVKPACKNCGREGLVKGKPDGPLKGRWWCPSREGGCNSKFDPGDIPPPGKVENDNPHALAETILLMASKRSFVHGVRRATGTSGYFTQDEDIVRTAEGISDDDDKKPAAEVKPEPVKAIEVERGAKTKKPTTVQLRRVAEVAREKDMGSGGLARVMNRLFSLGLADEPTNKTVSETLKSLTADQVGQLLQTLETGAVPAEEVVDALLNGGMSDEVAEALYPDDIGAK